MALALALALVLGSGGMQTMTAQSPRKSKGMPRRSRIDWLMASALALALRSGGMQP